MAEIVEYRVEKTLDELKLLVDFGIFDEQSAREVLKKRETFEYGLRKCTKSKLDYLKYIRFEMNLLESIEKYRKTILKNTETMKDAIDCKIFRLQAKKLNQIIRARSAHISFLYRKLVTKFQFDKRLWIAYIDFAKQRKWNKRVSALYWRLLRVASDDQSLWVDAAMHELNVNQDQSTACKLLLMGLRHHPKSLDMLSKLEEICDSATVKKYREQVEKDNSVVITLKPSSIEPSRDATKYRSKMEQIYECYESKGIDETRKLYSDLEKSIKNQTLSLYVGMIQVEMWQLAKENSEQQVDRIRTIYDKALTKFGHNKAKLWYEYIQFENGRANSLHDLERVNQLYSKAQASLNPSQVNRVIEKYTLMQTNQGIRMDIDFSDYSDLDD